MTNIFTPAAAHDRNTSTRLATVYRAAGITAPTTFVAQLREHLRTLPDARQVAATIAHDAYTAEDHTDLTDFWDDARDQMSTALATDALRAQLAGALETEERAQAGRQVDRALADLRPHFDRTVKALTIAAAKLPASTAALDPEANLAADTGKHLTTARDALATLALFAAIPETNRYVSSVQRLAVLLPILDFDKPTIEIRTTFGDTLNPDKLAHTQQLRTIGQDKAGNTDQLLIDIARGAFPGIRFALANNRVDIQNRAQKASDAFRTRQPSPSEESLYHFN